MNGIDIASYQAGINLSTVPCDFVIVKATQGNTYVNPDFKRAVDQALSVGKCVGVYHYAGGKGVDAEVAHFLNTVKPYLKKVILVLDWEGEQNQNFAHPEWAKVWLATVYQKTGIFPFLYMSKSVCRTYNWADIAPFTPLWAAQYADNISGGYRANPWTDSKGFGAWGKCVILQYSSVGKLPGYGKELDLNIGYLTKEEWKRYAMGTANEDQTAVEIPEYIPGRVYTLQVELKVRKGAGTGYLAKRHSELTNDGRKHDADGDGALDKGTKVSCLEVARNGNDVWIRCPSGWLAAYYQGHQYIKYEA